MSERLRAALREMRDVLREEAHDHCVRIDMSLTSEGYSFTQEMRDPRSLRLERITMRNLRGEWIADKEESK